MPEEVPTHNAVFIFIGFQMTDAREGHDLSGAKLNVFLDEIYKASTYVDSEDIE